MILNRVSHSIKPPEKLFLFLLGLQGCFVANPIKQHLFLISTNITQIRPTTSHQIVNRKNVVSYYSPSRSIHGSDRHLGLGFCKKILSLTLFFCFYDFKKEVSHNRGTIKVLQFPLTTSLWPPTTRSKYLNTLTTYDKLRLTARIISKAIVGVVLQDTLSHNHVFAP